MFAWFWIVAHWLPLREGRDMMTYFIWFRDLFQIRAGVPVADALSNAADSAVLRDVL